MQNSIKKYTSKRRNKSSIKTRNQESSTITMCYPPHAKKLTETVNFLKKGRNVADTLWSAHILYKTPIYWESIMQSNPLSL